MPAAPPGAIADDLDKACDALMSLIADIRRGTPYGRPDVRHADHEERGQAIAQSIVAPFRGKQARPVAAPLARTATGAWF